MPDVTRITFELVVAGQTRSASFIREDKIAELLDAHEALGDFLEALCDMNPDIGDDHYVAQEQDEELVLIDPVPATLFEQEFSAWLPGALERAGVSVPTEEPQRAKTLFALTVGNLVSTARASGYPDEFVQQIVAHALSVSFKFKGAVDA